MLTTEMEAARANNLALLLIKQGHFEAGLVLHHQACRLDPGNPQYWLNLAALLVNEGHTQEAMAAVGRAKSCNAPGDAAVARQQEAFAYTILGFTAMHEGHYAGACADFRHAAALLPDNVHYQFDYAHAVLGAGNWARGFELYEGRRKWRREREFGPIPSWKGEEDCHLFVWAEQGAGDAIQFSRYVNVLRRKVRRLTFGVPLPLHGLLSGYSALRCCDGDPVAVTSEHDLVSGVDAELALMSAPLFCGTNEPGDVPADPDLLTVASTEGLISARGKKRVGLCWAGNKVHVRDRYRSMPFECMLGLAEDPMLQLFSLQVGERSQDVARFGAQPLVTDLSGLIMHDWCATAAVLKALDVVVTVDTAIAHLAGALGVSTILCLPTCCDWRWGSAGSSTPWYPSVTIFRQVTPGDWREVLERVGSYMWMNKGRPL